MEKFVQGQRWISATEPELGLGMVIEVANRRVQLLFPAGGEMRMYASGSAPVKRVLFAVGDEVRGQDGVGFVVAEVRDDAGVVTYVGAAGEELGEAGLGDSMSFDKPQDRFFAGQVDEWPLFDLRLETLRMRHKACRSSVRGFVGGRVELIPHQLYIAHEVSRRQLPRVLLADEVGLGKTIEACLILHRLLVSGKAGRVLIVLPEALMHQWFVELLRRFNLNFAIYDEERCLAIARGGEEDANPFMDEQLVLCSINFLSENPLRALSAVEAEWDLLIVDEAHHLGWAPDAPSPEYALVDALAQKAGGLLLLTATPEQLGLESHFARLRLLDPDRYPSFEEFVEDHADYIEVAKEAEGLLDDPKALAELLDRHGPGRVMFRNTRANMSGFPKRLPHLVPLKPTDDKHDPRISWLADFLREHPEKKVLLICRTMEEVKRFDEALRQLITVNTALFHEDMPLILRDRQAAWFAEDDGARLLIASEIGGEGRNFQFVHDLVLISLPDDPELLEQRIGRLDRIGQKHDINVHVPYLEGTEEAHRIRWYHEGLDAFSKPLVGGWEIQQKFADRLDKVNDKLIKETRAFCSEVQTRIERGRDRLLDLNSFRPDVAESVVQQIADADEDRALEKYLLKLFDHFGVHAEPLDGRDYLLMPGHLFDSAFPLTNKEGMHITFDRNRAIVREDITLMTWDHPMVDGGMEMILGSEIGNSTVAATRDRDGLVLEAVYLLECVAPAWMEVNRFLPPTPLVVQVDQGLLDMVEEEEWIAPSGDASVWDVLNDDLLKREVIPAMLKQARRVAMTERQEVVNGARAEMQDVLGDECKRLKHLQQVNDHVRADEVEAAFAQLTELDVALNKARLRLDAVRFFKG